jgi:hypothetical protein
MEALKFSEQYRGIALSSALFHVEVAEDPDLDFEQGVCVILNSEFPAFTRAVEEGDASASALLWEGVLRRVLCVGISVDFAFSGSPVPGSVGAHVSDWLQTAFPGMERDDIRRLRENLPSRFEAIIQSWSRSLADIYRDSAA